MNKRRREKISKCISDLEEILEEEDMSRDNIPENLQDTDLYLDSEAASECLQEAIDTLNEIV